MIIFKKPRNSVAYRYNNVVLGYYENYAIVRNDMGKLSYIYCFKSERDFVPVGSVVENSDLTPLEYMFDEDSKKAIKLLYEKY